MLNQLPPDLVAVEPPESMRLAVGQMYQGIQVSMAWNRLSRCDCTFHKVLSGNSLRELLQTLGKMSILQCLFTP